MQKNKFMPTIVLSAICIFAVAVLAFVNIFTESVIQDNQEKKANEALLEVMPNGIKFSEIDIAGLPAEVTNAYRAESGGYVFQMTVAGYKPGLVIMCGVDADGKITGSRCIASNETMDVEYTLDDAYIGKTQDDYAEVVSSATAKLTINGYRSAIEAALEAFGILTGGEE